MKSESKSLLRKIKLKCKVQKELKPQNTSSEGKLYLIPHLFRKAMDKDENLPRTEGSGLCLSGQLEHRGQKKNVMKSLAEKKKKKKGGGSSFQYLLSYPTVHVGNPFYFAQIFLETI